MKGVLSWKFNVSQGTGQGRIFAPFMYKVYIISVLCELSDHCFSVSINGLRLPSPSFADDISLLALHPSLLQTFMTICFDYGARWRYKFNNSKSGIVTFGETKWALLNSATTPNHPQSPPITQNTFTTTHIIKIDPK